ncbi:peptidoglycan-binding domain-containing protein [Caminicella sporogenes]|uniref:peptidoglycan-binding domain-containing protein n=1 Tax=Caminicella sporogenes TaxID=166485 RepID=UPI002542303C|nr:peptidoglycan-binding protein [Caminicella sporogenes]WIF94214.1 peptidoglycan-binding protein [Caminicella sporogenes]
MRKVLVSVLTSVYIFTTTMTCFGQNFSLDVYKKGMNHKDIKIIQKALKKDGVYDYEKLTAYYGAITESAVKKFQKKYNLSVDGIAGKSTLSKMESLGLFGYGKLTQSVYKKGMRHNDIKILQRVLKEVGMYRYDKFTTYFGKITEEAVKEFQRKYGLKADGIVGMSTLEKMKSLGLISYTAAVSSAVSRGNVKRGYGEYLDWWKSVRKMLKRNKTVLTIQDFYTGLRFKVKVTAGTNHADVEPLTKNDTSIIKKIWGGFSWKRRPVLVYINGRVIAASMTAMPHAGVEGKPAGKMVSGRSGGFGYGYNYDFIKGNGVSGHMDIHFKNSRRHKDNKIDPKHQAAIKISAGLK